MLTYNDLAADSKVWVYQSNRPFTDQEVRELSIILEKFAEQWQSHGKQLSAYASLYHKHFIVLMVDEKAKDASGCSIDSSVHFLGEIEKQYDIKLFDRLTAAYLHHKDVRTASKSQVKELLASRELTGESLVFNNLVKNKAEFEQNWLIPLKTSWLASLVPVEQ